MSRTYTIRELAREFGITSRTLRHYEDEGLISPERRGTQRIYSARDRARVTLILRGRRVGFTLAEIGEILDLYNEEDHGAAQDMHARSKFVQRIAALERQYKDIEESIAELKLGVTRIDNRMTERHEEINPRPQVRVSGFGVLPAAE